MDYSGLLLCLDYLFITKSVCRRFDLCRVTLHLLYQFILGPESRDRFLLKHVILLHGVSRLLLPLSLSPLRPACLLKFINRLIFWSGTCPWKETANWVYKSQINEFPTLHLRAECGSGWLPKGRYQCISFATSQNSMIIPLDLKKHKVYISTLGYFCPPKKQLQIVCLIKDRSTDSKSWCMWVKIVIFFTNLYLRLNRSLGCTCSCVLFDPILKGGIPPQGGQR